jgi:hypothetical protein
MNVDTGRNCFEINEYMNRFRPIRGVHYAKIFMTQLTGESVISNYVWSKSIYVGARIVWEDV